MTRLSSSLSLLSSCFLLCHPRERGDINGAYEIPAFVCMTDCGERLYSQECISRFEQIREKLMCSDTTDFHPLGRSFQVV